RKTSYARLRSRLAQSKENALSRPEQADKDKEASKNDDGPRHGHGQQRIGLHRSPKCGKRGTVSEPRGGFLDQKTPEHDDEDNRGGNDGPAQGAAGRAAQAELLLDLPATPQDVNQSCLLRGGQREHAQPGLDQRFRGAEGFSSGAIGLRL